MNLEKAQKHIRNAWIAGIIYGTLILILSLLTLAGITTLPFRFNASLFYVILIYGLTLGIYKRNSVCAIFMFLTLLIHFLSFVHLLPFDRFITMPTQVVKFLVVIATLYFCFQGILGTFVYNRPTNIEMGYGRTSFKMPNILIRSIVIDKWILYFIGCLIFFSAVLFVTLPFYGKTPTEDDLIRHVQSNLKQVGLRLIMYANENDEKFPDKLSELYPDYIGEIRVFFYKDDKKKIITPENIDSHGCFEYMGAGLTTLATFADFKTVLAREKSNNHWKKHGNGRYELFLDGHVEWTGKDITGR